MTRFAYDADKPSALYGRRRSARSPKARYDAKGNLLATTRFAARPTLAQYDEGAIAAAVAPAAGRSAAIDVTRFAYDALNRLRFTVDALGSVSERVYDALGNVIEHCALCRAPAA